MKEGISQDELWRIMNSIPTKKDLIQIYE